MHLTTKTKRTLKNKQMTENITTYGTTTFHTYVSESKWFDEILKKMCIPTI